MAHELQRPGSLPNLFSTLKVVPWAVSTGYTLTSSDTTFGEKLISTVSLVGGSIFTLPENLYKTYIAATAAISTARFLPDLSDTFPFNYFKDMSITTYIPSSQEIEDVSLAIGRGIAQGVVSTFANLALTFNLSGFVDFIKPQNEKCPIGNAAVLVSLGSFLGINELYKTYYLETRDVQYWTAQITSFLVLRGLLKS